MQTKWRPREQKRNSMNLNTVCSLLTAEKMAYFSRNSPFYDPSSDRFNSPGGLNPNQDREFGLAATGAPRESPFKVQEGWRQHVHQQGDLFYVEVNNPDKQRYGYNPGKNTVSYDDKNFSEDVDDEYVSLNSVQPPTSNGFVQINRQNDVIATNLRNTETNNNHIHFQNGKRFKPKVLFSDRENGDIYQQQSNEQYLKEESPNYREEFSQVGKSSKIKHVYLMPNLRNCRNGDTSGIVLCEKLFGVILCQYNSKSLPRNSNNLEKVVRDRKVIVQGVVPGSGAELSGQIHRGDMLVCLNDEDISWLNLDQLFRSIPNTQMKLTFQAPVVVGPKQPLRSPPQVPPKTYLQPSSNSPLISSSYPTNPVKTRLPTGENILFLVSGEETPGSSVFLRNCLCTVMYLTLDIADGLEGGREDIIYQFPADNNKLTEVRGLFLTLCGVVPDVSGDSVKCCAMDYEGVKINMMFMKDGQDLFTIGAPESRIPPHTLSILMAELQQIIKVLFGSISNAFRATKNRSQLDQLFSLALHSALQNPQVISHGALTSHASKAYTDSMAGMRKLNLSQENQLLCDEILSEFEAGDFDDFLDNTQMHKRRSFSILGSCLFYKEHLLCSHLNEKDLIDVHLFMKHHCLLHLVGKQSVEELVIWRQVYPSQRNSEPSPPGYPEPKGKWYLLIVGMKHFLLGTLLEVGGCTKSHEGLVGPDPFYVGQAKATLVQFESDDANISECCEKRLSSELHGPSLVSADSILAGHKTKKEESIHLTPLKPQGSPRILATPTKISHSVSVFKWPGSPHYMYDQRFGTMEDCDPDRLSHGRGNSSAAGSDTSTPVMKRQGSKISYGSNDSSGSGNSNKGKKVSKSGSIFDINSHTSFSEDNFLQNIKVTSGSHNMLLHLVSFDAVEGVYVGPTPQELASSQGAIQYQVLQNFYKACLQIRMVFNRRKSSKTSNKCEMEGRFSHNSSFDCVEEHGLLFHYTPLAPQDSKKSPPTLDYWVVGRLCSDGREVYVCFHEAVPQSAVKIAFRVGFGT